MPKKNKGLDIFLSLGKISTSAQEEFVLALEQFFISEGLNPRTIGRTEFSSKQPLKFIKEVMQECCGTVVIAFERVYINSGTEMRNSSFEENISGEKLPSVWNQIEAGMAYTLEHPLLVITEKGLRNEGILEFGYDWYVQKVDLDPSLINTKVFLGIFQDWKRRLTTH